MNAVLILLVIALVIAVGGALLWKRRPRDDLTPPLPQAVAGTGLLDEAPEPVAGALPERLRAILDFEGPPGRVTLAKPDVTIGRHSDDDVRLSDLRVSRHHARLVLRPDGRFELVNETTSRSEPNPVLVNGSERAKAELHDGDVVSLGGPTFVFRLEPM